MKTLLYATDYSDNSIAAIKFAEVIRQKLHAKLHVLHVFDMSATLISTVSLSYARMEESSFKDHNTRLRDFCKKHLGKEPNEKEVLISVNENSIPSSGILEKAEAINADLIIIGMKGSNVVREFLIGSTTSSLIDKSYVPVLAVPTDTKAESIRRIVYATAFEEADILAVRRLVALAKPFKADIKLIHISPKSEYAGEDQMAWFKEMLQHKVEYPKLSFDLRFSENIVKSLREYLKEVDGTMIAMLEREGHSLLKSIWHQDIVKRMKTEVNLPLLSFHKKNL